MSDDRPLNYASPVGLEAEGARIGLTFCLECGSAILLIQGTPNPLRLHDDWHRRLKDTRERMQALERGGG